MYKKIMHTNITIGVPDTDTVGADQLTVTAPSVASLATQCQSPQAVILQTRPTTDATNVSPVVLLACGLRR